MALRATDEVVPFSLNFYFFTLFFYFFSSLFLHTFFLFLLFLLPPSFPSSLDPARLDTTRPQSTADQTDRRNSLPTNKKKPDLHTS